MSTSLIPLEPLSAEPSFALTQAQARLRKMVLDSVQSIHSKRNYAKASMICLPSVPADLSPVPCLWSTGRRWITFLHPLSTYGYPRCESWSAKPDGTE
jgi:hypothetical protein